MEDKELIDKWRKEFELYFSGGDASLIKKDDFGNFLDFNAYTHWQTWLAAKRNMPVVEIPKPNMAYDQVNDYFVKLTEKLESARIPYKVKGE